MAAVGLAATVSGTPHDDYQIPGTQAQAGTDLLVERFPDLSGAGARVQSVLAAYGVVTAVFQSDFGARLVGLPHAVPVSSWVPVLMFTVLFGLPEKDLVRV